jgi:hypothetical protein
MENELVVIEKETALAVFSGPKGLDPYLAKIKAEIDAFVPDVSTKKGRDAVASIAYKVAKSKTYLDGVGKDLVADLKELPKKIDEHRKIMRETLDKWKDEVRKPLTDWEEAEERRIATHKELIAIFNSNAAEVEALDSGELAAQILFIEAKIIGAHLEEFEAEAARAKDACLSSLRVALDTRLKYEAEQAELMRLRAEAAEREQKEREARIAKEAEERAKAQAEAAAQAEREAVAKREADAKAAAERRELELKLQAERAEREKAEANARTERVAKETEERIAREVAQKAATEAAELAKREVDMAHKAKINNAAASALVAGGLTQDAAKQVVILIANGVIPNVRISY